MADSLDVWLGGELVAELRRGRGRGNIRCRYTDAALDTWPLGVPVLSCSLPLSRRTADASAFCRGLLPEGPARDWMARQAGVPSNDTFGLLERFGVDIAGALTICHGEPGDRPASVIPYTDDELADEVRGLDDNPLGLHDDSELSIAGLQDKLLLVDLEDGRWGRPTHGYPSTHILKRDDPRRPGLVAAEAACLRLSAEVGLGDIHPQVTEIAGVPCLVVARFDRKRIADGIVRTHQEDACQALDVDIDDERGQVKYQRHGGPSHHQVAELLDRWAPDPLEALDRLVRVVAFTVAIANADAHGKNLGLLHPEPGEVRLAPLYDTVPTVLWPRLRTTAAMSVAGAWELGDIALDDIVREAEGWPYPPDRARKAATETLERLRDAARSGHADHEQVADLVAGRIGRLLS